jgi:hypothetical protein
MPKKMSRDKRRRAPVRTATPPRPARIYSVKDLLAQRTPGLTRVTAQVARADFWHTWLAAHLPAALAARITGIAEHNGTLVVFATSAAWSARLRYVLLELETELRAAAPELGAVRVRVLPRG